MQWLMLEGTPTLVMFDTGALVNLSKGQLALKKFEPAGKGTGSLATAGARTINTNYGAFRCTLGPDKEGKYREVVSQGMDQVTWPVPKWDLSRVNSEVLEKYKDIGVLPEYNGGDEIHILIGIRDPELQPKQIGALDAGTGIYKSAFVDMFGSDVIIAGPHPSFNSSLDQDYSYMAEGVNFLTELFEDRNIEDDLMQLELDDLLEDVRPECDKIDGVHQSYVPLTKLKERLITEEETFDYRCNNCSICDNCKKSPRMAAISRQEEIEQQVIDASIEIKYKERRVEVKLPFIRDPVSYLSEFFGATSNYGSAMKVYKQQCKKNTTMKSEMRKVQQDLVNRNFMTKLEDQPERIRNLVRDAPLKHFFPWRSVLKIDSVSTPCRLVVDSSMTRLNCILAKGINRGTRINEILVRSRVKKYVYSTDISKMYNQLHLHESAYPYSLFLYHESMDDKIEPEVYLLTRAWYGVTSTGAQAGTAIDRLVEEKKKEFPLAHFPMTEDRWVDDVLGGADTVEEREEQIRQCTEVLKLAGFNLKYVVRSGMDPVKEASSDNLTTKILGYTWYTEADYLAPGFQELNFNKKIRGAKRANEKPITSYKDVEEIMAMEKITKKVIASRVAEFYDPVGIYQPLKLTMKLEFASLNPMPWTYELSEVERKTWTNIL